MVNLMETKVGKVLDNAKLLKDAEAWIEAITPQLQRTIIRDWIQEDQLYRKGIDENGDIIGFYSRMTEILSRGRKREGTPFTLFDTGEFYRSMFVTALADSIIIDGNSTKMEDQNWWGDEILGLTDENFEKLVLEVKEKYIDYTKRILLENNI